MTKDSIPKTTSFRFTRMDRENMRSILKAAPSSNFTQLVRNCLSEKAEAIKNLRYPGKIWLVKDSNFFNIMIEDTDARRSCIGHVEPGGKVILYTDKLPCPNKTMVSIVKKVYKTETLEEFLRDVEHDVNILKSL